VTADKDDLQRAIDDFNHTLALLGVREVNQVAELARLKILIVKYPDHARQILTHHQASGTGNGTPGQGRNRSGHR
jgi:hypothetical protein